jgi:hypothetical protein
VEQGIAAADEVKNLTENLSATLHLSQARIVGLQNGFIAELLKAGC